MTDITIQSSEHSTLYWIMQTIITIAIAAIVYFVLSKLKKHSISLGILFAYMKETPITNKQLAKFLTVSDAKQLGKWEF